MHAVYAAGHADQYETSFEEQWNAERASFVSDVQKCALLNNFQEAVWTVMVLTEEEASNPHTWHWSYLKQRLEFIRF